ncbi:hypothetical protein K2173_026509 [Erythroxylum novogranatense]|uniref:F-box domain-containing protein n=1 Tax=Erythroxylum novogranatense TaxID=1862640 RepID=A0AAV8TWN5_9ROSI|nr:hypothetical protein K2173_026509 [Erythroxylum novogranatense]
MRNNKRRSRETMTEGNESSPLPLAIIKDILSRMPVKTVTRFQSVSKPWSALIKSPDFVATHLRQSSRDPSLLIRRFHNPTGSNFAMISFNMRTAILRDIRIPFLNSLFRLPKIVGSSNGLVCFDISHCHASAFVLWNISTTQFKAIPNPQINDARRPFWMVASGFGYNREVDDYKLVRVVNFHPTEDELPVVRVEVYSWSTGSWKVIDHRSTDDTIGSCVITEGVQAVNVNGCLYWLGVVAGKLADGKIVVSFDMGTEEFKLTAIPDFVNGVCVKILDLDGSLALALYPSMPVLPGRARPVDRTEIWVYLNSAVENKRWAKVTNISGFGCPVGILRGSELIMKRVDTHCISLSSLDLISDTVKRLPACGSEYSCDICSYVDSLVPVDSEIGGPN